MQQALEYGDPLVGQTFEGRFQILSVLGQGGMGMVYKARHVHMDKLVAIKTLVPAAVSDDKSFLRFEQEARAASNLQHPNIISIFDFGRSADGTAYLVMEFLEGKTLEAELIEQIELISLARFERIFTQVCSGMQHAHKKGVIHRDIKPSNLMLLDTEEGKDVVKIVDFGLAKLHSRDKAEQHLTQTGMVMGSPPFMSPEQCRGDELDPRTDIYSLGCVMYAALTGQVPHMGNNSMATIYKHISDVPLPISEVLGATNVPPRLEELVMRTLAKHKDDRPQSMEDLGKSITAAIQNPGMPAVTKTAVIAGTDLAQALPIRPKLSEPPVRHGEQKSTPADFKPGTVYGASPAPPTEKTGSRLTALYLSLIACLLFAVFGFSLLKNSFKKPVVTSNQTKSPAELKPVSTPKEASSTGAKNTVSAPASAPSQSNVQLASSKTPVPASSQAPASSLTQTLNPVIAHPANAIHNASQHKSAPIDYAQKKKHDALEKAAHYRDEGRLAFENRDYEKARQFYEKYLSEESTAYGAEDPHLLHPIGRILACTRGKEDPDAIKLLELALKIVADERKIAFETVNETQSPWTTWRSLGYACLQLSKDQIGPGKRSYSQWSEYFFEYAVETWGAEKSDDYYKMLRSYAIAAMECGDREKVNELRQQCAAAGQPFIGLPGVENQPPDKPGFFQRGNRLGKHRPGLFNKNNW